MNLFTIGESGQPFMKWNPDFKAISSFLCSPSILNHKILSNEKFV